jgi:hypothetical protein
MPTTTWQTYSRERGNCGWEISGNFATNGEFNAVWRDLLLATNLWHGTGGFTSPKKACWRLQSGLNPQTWVPEASMLTLTPPKPPTSYLSVVMCMTAVVISQAWIWLWVDMGKFLIIIQIRQWLEYLNFSVNVLIMGKFKNVICVSSAFFAVTVNLQYSIHWILQHSFKLYCSWYTPWSLLGITLTLSNPISDLIRYYDFPVPDTFPGP